MADDLVPTVEFAALADERSCSLAKKLDGTTWAYGSEEHLAHTPPLEQCEFGKPKCTCVLIYHNDPE
jgi:hypothetical protein